jgi:hypothetical protein
MPVKLPKIPKNWQNNTKKLPLVSVTWMDACTHVGWKSWDYLEGAGLTEIITIGYLLPYTKDIVKVAPSIGEGGEMGDTWMIPRAWVKKVKRVK